MCYLFVSCFIAWASFFSLYLSLQQALLLYPYRLDGIIWMPWPSAASTASVNSWAASKAFLSTSSCPSHQSSSKSACSFGTRSRHFYGLWCKFSSYHTNRDEGMVFYSSWMGETRQRNKSIRAGLHIWNGRFLCWEIFEYIEKMSSFLIPPEIPDSRLPQSVG